MEKKRRSVGVVITTIIGGTRYALLQQRGHFDPEKLPKTCQSWPGICQVSAHGTVEEGDTDLIGALLRELIEELGGPLAQVVATQRTALEKISEAQRPGEEVVTFAFKLSAEVLDTVPRGAFGLRLVTAMEAADIQDTTQLPDGKQHGAPDNRIWMFPDERAAVQRALGFFPA